MILRLFSCLAMMTAGALFAAPLPPAPADSFTIAALPDTQGYHGRGAKRSPDSSEPVDNPVLTSHLDWLLANREAQRIVFVTHVGDIVDYNRHEEWLVARRELDRLRGVLPFSLTVGNHDMEADGNASLYQRYFPAARFEAFSWYAGTFEPDATSLQVSGNNVNSVQLFSAGGFDFVHLSLECNAPDPVVAWADGQLSHHADRIALITTHMDLGPLEKPSSPEGYMEDPKGRMSWTKIHGERGNSPEQLWHKLYRKHRNLLLIFSGDQSRTMALRLSQPGDHGNTVHAVLSDYGSSGPMRLYRFLPAERRIEVITYDTFRGEIVESSRWAPSREEHQFNLEWDPPRR